MDAFAFGPMELRRRDGEDLAGCAQSVAPSGGTPLSFGVAGVHALMLYIERLKMRITELESLRATDPLTGAWNRTQLACMVDVEINRAARSGQPVTLIMLDIDHFKRVNDAHGHLVGDAVLKEFVVRIRKRTRNSDLLFRWGGDEFVVLATSVGKSGAAILAEGLRAAISATPFPEVGSITASLGLAEYEPGETAERWFLRTDEAMYAAKSAGRNRICLGPHKARTPLVGAGGRLPAVIPAQAAAARAGCASRGGGRGPA